MEIRNIVGAGVAAAFGMAAAEPFTSPAPGVGHDRAVARLLANAAWQAEFYRDTPAPDLPTRQMQRRFSRKVAKANAARERADAIRTRDKPPARDDEKPAGGRIEPKFVGNATGSPASTRKPGSPINRIGNLQRSITAEAAV